MSLIIFLKFMSSVMPTVQYDQSLDIEIWNYYLIHKIYNFIETKLISKEKIKFILEELPDYVITFEIFSVKYFYYFDEWTLILVLEIRVIPGLSEGLFYVFLHFSICINFFQINI